MPRFSANLSMLFPEHDFLARFPAAAKAGFTGVEYVGPYAYPKEQVAELLQKHNLKQVLFNLPAGNWEAGERGLGCLPDRVDEFKAGVAKAIEYATALGCKQVNCLAGIAPAGVSASVGTVKVAAAGVTAGVNVRVSSTVSTPRTRSTTCDTPTSSVAVDCTAID